MQHSGSVKFFFRSLEKFIEFVNLLKYKMVRNKTSHETFYEPCDFQHYTFLFRICVQRLSLKRTRPKLLSLVTGILTLHLIDKNGGRSWHETN